MLYLFDLDGTLITSYMDSPSKDYNDWRVHNRVVLYLQHIIQGGHQVGIVTNQAGVAWGFVTEAQANAKIAAAVNALGLPVATPVAVCYADVRGKAPYNDPQAAARRKPSGAMIRELMVECGVTAEETIFCGDRPEDAAAAADAGVRFVHEAQFFEAPVRWSVVDGWAIRPSDGKRFLIERTRTKRGYALCTALEHGGMGGEAAIHAVCERLQVRVVKAWGEPDDTRPWGQFTTSLDDGPWVADPDPYVLSGY